MTLREFPHVHLGNALALVVVYARSNSPKFEPTAVRWPARLAVEGRDVKLADLQLAAAALVSLRGHRTNAAEKTLLRLL